MEYTILRCRIVPVPLVAARKQGETLGFSWERERYKNYNHYALGRKTDAQYKCLIHAGKPEDQN